MFDDFYGLAARPFQLTPDPAFYFESLTHRKALSYLGYGLAQGEGFVVITGEVGAGKSTLVAHLMATIDPAMLTAAQVVTSALDGEEIVHVVAHAFGIEVEGHDKATALAMIEQFLHEEARAGRRCLLIVDESQNLEIGALEELRMLSNFQLGAHPLLQTLLLGQPEFRGLLLDSPELEQLRQRVIATHHLEAMQPDEIQLYIEHRMNRAGWQGNPSFDEHVFAEIHKATGGIPRRVNQVVNRLLLLGAVEQRERIDSAMLAQVLGELNEDGTIALVSPQSKVQAQQPVPAPAAASGPTEQERADAVAAAAALEVAVAERDAQIQELQQAVVELANTVEEREENRQVVHAELVAAIDDQIAALDARLSEQDRTIRHALTMIIEWIESGDENRAAA
ncbi:putative secretion ATPase (PEP-CTERM system associated) [Novosphingobium chloroacetimidivorans]|uniref:Putative secretion ATPase (PEP-CTERM system associated) n=1 Tax=Novosphingobium chloroacetimidivorans TaxID=1428314 RepID=A0A7W7K971_9SPHN|nr:XrtA/PEP-CTERM system-associated ATPase [Novosphingobium chloroacetimidivorans]MBB4858521.1 putative secretion ATPase (PEP-CTERM system associated) [Novosphingobium chloroacetimidivorans]